MQPEPRPLLFNQNIHGRVAHLHRSANAVLEKIQKVYGLTDEDVALPATVPLKLPADKEAAWQKTWNKACHEQAERCGIVERERERERE